MYYYNIVTLLRSNSQWCEKKMNENETQYLKKSIENFIEIHLLIYTMTLFEKSNCGNYPKW